MISLYSNIRSKRLELRLTQEQLAQRLGYKNKSTIAKIEAGKSDLPQSKISEFAQALGTTPAQLMGWSDDQQTVKPRLNEYYQIELGQLPIVSHKSAALKLLSSGHNTLALKVIDENMYPEYFCGDTVIIKVQPSYENGDDCAVVCSGKKQILIRKIIFTPGKITLESINTDYKPISYAYPSELTILGRVVELHRKK